MFGVSTINSDEHDAKHGVRSVREQPTATERSDKPWAYCISTGQLRESKGESVSGAECRRAERTEVQRRRTVSTDLHVNRKVLAQLYFVCLFIAAHVAQLRRARPRSATGSPLIPGQNPIFQTSPEKTTSITTPCRADLTSNR